LKGRHITPSDIGRDIIQWGRGQGDADVAQTQDRLREINPRTVKDMIQQGLDRPWVERQLSMYQAAIRAGGKKLLNTQLFPRLELLDAILRNWPND
jgi:hypothetical protein